ncbi:helix-turn-helix transcriptional regulator [Desulforamulus ruminis]|uniref:helix-turn-helix transcriptional regulator n=1 Tax=Desulforamulus ruminis TaxID=1564 RepID=UPI002357A3FC|nr:helix-turn-helix transcriptional regulator [Desulforamulus ruminis]
MKNRLKYYRMQREPKILQQEIAEHIGTDAAQISQMENGHYIPSLKVALLVAEAYTKLLGEKVYVDNLFSLERTDRKR